MLKRSFATFLIPSFACAILSAQELSPNHLHQPTLTPQDSGTTNGLIAVSPVNPQVVWASGRNGTFTVTTDGGETWNAGVVPGAEALQFRDVQAFSASVAYLMSIGANPTDFRVYKTLDGGATWTIQFENQNPNGFYDAFAFWTPQRGILHGDSINGVFPDFRTTNGMTWQDISSNMPPALPGEGSFASSGTCVTTQGGQERVDCDRRRGDCQGTGYYRIRGTPGTRMIRRCLARPARAHSPSISAIRITESWAAAIWMPVIPITRAPRFRAMAAELGLLRVRLR